MNNETAQNNTSSNRPTIDRQELPRFDDNPFPRPTFSKLEEIKEREDPPVQLVNVKQKNIEVGPGLRIFRDSFESGTKNFINKDAVENMLRPYVSYVLKNTHAVIIIRVSTNVTPTPGINSDVPALMSERQYAVYDTLKKLGLSNRIKFGNVEYGDQKNKQAFSIEIK